MTLNELRLFGQAEALNPAWQYSLARKERGYEQEAPPPPRLSSSRQRELSESAIMFKANANSPSHGIRESVFSVILDRALVEIERGNQRIQVGAALLAEIAHA